MNAQPSRGMRTTRGASALVIVVLVAMGLALVPSTASAATGPLVNVSSGRYHSCGLTPETGVKCWGNNTYGQLGNGTRVPDSPPGAVAGLTGVTRVSASGDHTCAVLSSNSLRCWGGNVNGELGVAADTTPASATPVTPAGMTTGVTAVSSGWTGTCAVKSGGVWCWGYPFGGPTPTPVPGMASGVARVATGWFGVCAATTTDVRCWTPVHATLTVPGVAGPDVLNFSGSLGSGSFDTYCAVVTGNRGVCWRNTFVGGVTAATAVAGLPAVSSVALRLRGQACAIGTGTGVIYCWDVDVSSPGNVRLVALDKVAAHISGGYGFSCTTTKAGRPFCWGKNDAGQLADGTRTDRATPVPVKGLA